MRSSTKTFVGLAGIGVLVATAKFGLPAAAVAATANTVSDTAVSTTNSNTSTTTPATATNTASGSSTKATVKKATTTTAKKTTTTATKKSTTTASTGTSTGTTTPAPSTTPAATATSNTSSSVGYRFGTVQLKVTKKSGHITSVTCINCTATNGREGAFAPLISAAVSANGSNFGNLGGATYTTQAFKQALDNALGKF